MDRYRIRRDRQCVGKGPLGILQALETQQTKADRFLDRAAGNRDRVGAQQQFERLAGILQARARLIFGKQALMYGFLAGVVRKKLGLNLVSEQTDKGRVYRIRDGKASVAAAGRAKQAA